MSKPPPGPRPTPLDELLAPTNGHVHTPTPKQDDWPTFSARGVDPAITKRIRLAAVLTERTMGEIVTEALKRWLDTHESGA